MKTILTGMNGTVAPALATSLSAHGHSIIRWERSLVPTDNPEAIRRFIGEAQPDWLFHIATGDPRWAEYISHTCAEQGVKLLFTSSVSVFSNAQQGPFTVDSLPQPNDEYGHYKLHCEQLVQAACPNATIVRLGWQIGLQPGGNQMLAYLERTFQSQGYIEASSEWYPACSFLADTADSLIQLMEDDATGLFHLDGNPGLSFYQIVSQLNRLKSIRQACAPWVVRPSTAFIYNNRMVDERVAVRPITELFQNS